MTRTHLSGEPSVPHACSTSRPCQCSAAGGHIGQTRSQPFLLLGPPPAPNEINLADEAWDLVTGQQCCLWKRLPSRSSTSPSTLPALVGAWRGGRCCRPCWRRGRFEVRPLFFIFFILTRVCLQPVVGRGKGQNRYKRFVRGELQ